MSDPDPAPVAPPVDWLAFACNMLALLALGGVVLLGGGSWLLLAALSTGSGHAGPDPDVLRLGAVAVLPALASLACIWSGIRAAHLGVAFRGKSLRMAGAALVVLFGPIAAVWCWLRNLKPVGP